MPMYSNSRNNYQLNANQQKNVHDHIIYYDKWSWVKPCLRFFTYGVLIILIIYWFVFAAIALINNPPSQVNAICKNTGLNALLISQIIWSGFITIERLSNYCNTKTKPAIICTLCVSGWCLFIWCFGALWGSCSKNNLTNLDVYKSVYSWFIIYTTLISMMFVHCCLYKKIKRMCFNSKKPTIINLESQQQPQQHNIRKKAISTYPHSLTHAYIPHEPINYAEL